MVTDRSPFPIVGGRSQTADQAIATGRDALIIAQKDLPDIGTDAREHWEAHENSGFKSTISDLMLIQFAEEFVSSANYLYLLSSVGPISLGSARKEVVT